MASTQFSEFLKRKRQRETSTPPIDWEGRKEAWLAKLGWLFAEITTYLKPYREEGDLDFFPNTTQIQEDFIGTYEVPVLKIQVGADTVEIIPKGSLIIGAFGRVDMTGPQGKLVMVLNETGESPSIEVRILQENDLKEVPEESPDEGAPSSVERINQSRWYFSNKSRLPMTPVDEDTFISNLQIILRP